MRGYRAPSFSIGHGNLWAFDVLAEAGYRYSSSVYPVRHDHYGMPDAPRFAYQRAHRAARDPDHHDARAVRRNLPAGGGGYFRLAAVSRVALGDRGGSTASTGSRRSSTSIRGRSIPDQPRVARRQREDALPPLPESRPHRSRA